MEDPAFQKSMIYFLGSLIRDMGDPPDLDRAKRIAQQSSIQIRYESPNQSWFTSESLSMPPQAEWRAWEENPDIRVGMNPGGHFFVWERGEERFFFKLPHPFTRDFLNMKDIVILTALLAANLAGAYLLIRWILNPIRGLAEGVKEVGKGNLDHRVRLKRTDELGELGMAYNAMTERLRKMIRAKEQLLLDVSHELRSPLTRIKVALESLSEGNPKQSIREDVADSFHSDEPVRISMEEQKPYMIVRIQDNGVGIPEDELPYIFEPFYRVDKSRSKDTGGYGLGLSLCKTVMEAHHGKIEVDSSPDRGTTVSLFFPL